MNKPRTICVHCMHCIYNMRNAMAATSWYNYTCRANILHPASIDPVTGLNVSLEYKYCKDVNKGECPTYKPK